MTSRCKFQNASEIGAYARITNAYALLPFNTSENFFSIFQQQLGDQIPVIHTSIGGTSIVGRLSVGNSKGLLVSSITTDQELQQIRDALPDEVKVLRLEEKLSALGNVIVTNDYFALVHPEVDDNSIALIEDTLGVECVRQVIGGESLVGSYCVTTNKGCVVSPNVSVSEINELAQLLSVPVTAATVNRGQAVLGAGICVNDFHLFCGWETTAIEIANLSRIFNVSSAATEENLADFTDSLIDAIL